MSISRVRFGLSDIAQPVIMHDYIFAEVVGRHFHKVRHHDVESGLSGPLSALPLLQGQVRFGGQIVPQRGEEVQQDVSDAWSEDALGDEELVGVVPLGVVGLQEPDHLVGIGRVRPGVSDEVLGQDVGRGLGVRVSVEHEHPVALSPHIGEGHLLRLKASRTQLTTEYPLDREQQVLVHLVGEAVEVLEVQQHDLGRMLIQERADLLQDGYGAGAVHAVHDVRRQGAQLGRQTEVEVTDALVQLVGAGQRLRQGPSEYDALDYRAETETTVEALKPLLVRGDVRPRGYAVAEGVVGTWNGQPR